MEVGDPRKIAKGIISNDPLNDLSIGSAIHFRLLEFGRSNATERPNSIRNWEFFNGAITAVGLKSATSHNVVGTAIIVAPGLAITATHILHDAIGEITAGNVVPYCFGIRADGLEIWRVTRLSYVESDDIALLSLEAVSSFSADATYYRLGLSTRAPRQGERLDIFGFRSAPVTDQTLQLGVTGNFYTSNGVVANVYPYGRDKLLLPYPVIEMNCGSLGGMSGGAAIDEHGLVVGVVSRGFDTEDGWGPTYVSWIIGSLVRSIAIPWPPGFYKGSVSPLSIDRRILFIDRPDALSEGKANAWSYQIWFE